MSHKSQGPLISANTVVLEPVTKIMHFQGIQWEIQKVVTGAIAGLLFGDNKDQKKSFYKSAVSRKNKEILLQLASQVYAYLDGTISEFADIDDYVFRIRTRVIVNKVNGSIVGNPIFEVEIYKLFGSVGAKGTETKERLKVIFIGSARSPIITSQMNRLLSNAVKEFKTIEFSPYFKPELAPQTVREKIIKNLPTLVIGEKAFAVKFKITEDGTECIYIDDDGKEFKVTGVRDMVVFLSKNSGLKPDILPSATVFDSLKKINDEMRSISNTIMKDVSKRTEEEDLVKSLGLEDAIKKLEESLASLKQGAPEGILNELSKIEGEVVNIKEHFKKLKVDYEAASIELKNIEEKFKNREIMLEQYEVTRWKILRTRESAKDELIELQAHVKGLLTNRLYMIIGKSNPAAKAK